MPSLTVSNTTDNPLRFLPAASYLDCIQRNRFCNAISLCKIDADIAQRVDDRVVLDKFGDGLNPHHMSGLMFEMMAKSFFIARQTIIPRVGSGMAMCRQALCSGMARNARDAVDYCHVSANRVIEQGTQIEI